MVPNCLSSQEGERLVKVCTSDDTREHCKKKESVSALLRNMALHMTDDSLSSKRNIFTATHSVFLHQIDRGSLASHIGWELGKIPTWWEKFRHGGKNSSLEMGQGRKNSHIVGKIPTWLEKKTGRGIHEPSNII
jgi:hypothetical protein